MCSHYALSSEAEIIRKNVTVSQAAIEQGEALARGRTRGNFSLMIEQLIEAEVERQASRKAEVVV